jgi:hypothetical protein
MFEDEVRNRIVPDLIDSVELLQYGDLPEIERGQLLGKIFIALPDGTDPEDNKAHVAALSTFSRTNREALAEVRKTFAVTSFGGGMNDVTFPNTIPASPRGPMVNMTMKAAHVQAMLRPGGDQTVTAVMARLGREDLETLDSLIAAGIASSRAEAVRWALARIRQRPAYEQLRARSREIEALKSQF